jgi:heptosyltransferase-2
VPVVTVFGPTDPRWSDTGFKRERIVRVDVPCGPCGKKRCPLRDTQRDQCMLKISPEMVLPAAGELLAMKERA